MRNPSSQAWQEKIPAQDTAPPEEEALPQPRPEEWGVTADEARELLERQMCPVCGEGPWVSPLNHVSRKHAINRHVMRDICGLSYTEKVTESAARDAWSRNGSAKSEVLKSNAARAKGKKRSKPARRTRAFERSMQESGLVKWMADHPDEIAELRAGFRDRMNSPEARAKWEASMARVRASREYTDEEREAFKEKMNAPDVVAKRQATLDERRIDDCSIDGCTEPHVAKGLCRRHWARVQRTGRPGPADKREPGKFPRHARRALTDEQMEDVRQAYAAGGETQHQIAERFGTTQTVISRVVRGQYE